MKCTDFFFKYTRVKHKFLTFYRNNLYPDKFFDPRQSYEHTRELILVEIPLEIWQCTRNYYEYTRKLILVKINLEICQFTRSYHEYM